MIKLFLEAYQPVCFAFDSLKVCTDWMMTNIKQHISTLKQPYHSTIQSILVMELQLWLLLKTKILAKTYSYLKIYLEQGMGSHW